MLHLAIIGGGLSGLALARAQQQAHESWGLFEARGRLGGRILTVPGQAGQPLDLGPTWYWPETQPRLTALIAELGLASVAQHDDGTARVLRDPAQPPTTAAVPDLHQGARRLVDGMGALAKALESSLSPQRVHLEHELTHVRDRGAFLELSFRVGAWSTLIQARQVAICLPPRLLVERVVFEPALPARAWEALRGTPTWMASAAKVQVLYLSPFWRDQGHSGNAFVTHAQAVLGEIFDACGDPPDAAAALGGFFALSAEQRDMFRSSLALLARNQLAQVFGPDGEWGELHMQDWAQEPLTCSRADRDERSGQHGARGNPLLSQPLWGGRLYLGGAETAEQGWGYLEGALASAGRIGRLLRPAVSVGNGENDLPVARFADWVARARASAAQRYQQELHRLLSSQHRDELTRTAVLAVVAGIYREALDELATCGLALHGVPVEQGRSALTPAVLAPFHGFSDSFLAEAIQHNGTSCAISNFPDEHIPGPDTLHRIRQGLAGAWRDFALAANALLIAGPPAGAEG